MTLPRMLARHLRGSASRLTLRLAGHAAFADLEHVGRKSGILRHTPVRAFRSGDMVVIGLNFGRRSDWFQNLEAAGTCRMRLGRQQLTLGAPVVVPAEQGTRMMPWLFRIVMRYMIRTAECAELPILDEHWVRPRRAAAG